jgi:hypothetical protein
VPSAIEALVGPTTSDTRVAGATRIVDEPVNEPYCAWTVALPTEAPWTIPAIVTLATPAALELQLASAVRSCVELSEYVPMR